MTVSYQGRSQIAYPRLFTGVFLIAFATLLLEVSFIRVLSYTIWYHFAYVIIASALLGYGASGTLLAVRPKIGAGNLRGSLAAFTLFAAFTCLGALGYVAFVPLHPMSILSDPKQMFVLVTYLIVGVTPFFFSGLAVCLSLREAATRVDRLYFWDLVGAGLGCLSAVYLMNLLSPPGAVVVAGAAFTTAAFVFATAWSTRFSIAVVTAVLVAGSGLARHLPFTPARTKEISTHIRELGMEPRLSYWSALFRTDLVENVRPLTDTKHCPEWGVSVVARSDCDQPLFYVAHDGTAGTYIYDLRKHAEFPHFGYNVLHSPYLIVNPDPHVLVIGVGGGRDLIMARQNGAAMVTGVELDPNTLKIIKSDVNDVANGFFNQPAIRLMKGEGRHFVRSTDEKFDLIQLTGVDTLAAEFSGAYVLAENYLYTTEAIHDYLDHLKPRGILSFTTGGLVPHEPRAPGRMVSIGRRALLERGIERPEDHIAVIDSGRLFVEIMIRAEPFEAREVALLKAYAERMKFLPLWLPGSGGHPVFRGLASFGGAERRKLLDQLKYDVSATTDDRPFFFSLYRWRDLLGPVLLAPTHVSALGQTILALLVIALTFLGAVFVLGPLLVLRRRGILEGGGEAIGILLYFLAVGLGFMLFEVSLIQRFILFLGYPTYSLTVTIFSLLIFAGLGSFLSRNWVGREKVFLPAGVLALAALAAFYMKGFPPIQAQLIGTPILIRSVVTIAVLTPLGLVMGMFFPLGVRRAASVHEDLVPWAWAINGCASVTAAVLAVALAMSQGFARVWILSVCIYALGVGALLITGRRSQAPAQSGA